MCPDLRMQSDEPARNRSKESVAESCPCLEFTSACVPWLESWPPLGKGAETTNRALGSDVCPANDGGSCKQEQL